MTINFTHTYVVVVAGVRVYKSRTLANAIMHRNAREGASITTDLSATIS